MGPGCEGGNTSEPAYQHPRPLNTGGVLEQKMAAPGQQDMSGAFRNGKTVTKIHSGSDYFWPRF